MKSLILRLFNRRLAPPPNVEDLRSAVEAGDVSNTLRVLLDTSGDLSEVAWTRWKPSRKGFTMLVDVFGEEHLYAPFEMAVHRGNLSLVEAFLQAGVPVRRAGLSALEVALVTQGEPGANVLELLLSCASAGSLVHTRDLFEDRTGVSLLHARARRGDVHNIAVLLVAGDNASRGMVHAAVTYPPEDDSVGEAVDLLAQAGMSYETAANLLWDSLRKWDFSVAIHIWALSPIGPDGEATESVFDLETCPELEPCVVTRFQPLCLIACRSEDFRFLETLLLLGADPWVPAESLPHPRGNLLHFLCQQDARRSCCHDLFELLLGNGVATEPCDSLGHTILHEFCLNGNVWCVQELLLVGADVLTSLPINILGADCTAEVLDALLSRIAHDEAATETFLWAAIKNPLHGGRSVLHDLLLQTAQVFSTRLLLSALQRQPPLSHLVCLLLQCGMPTLCTDSLDAGIKGLFPGEPGMITDTDALACHKDGLRAYAWD